MKLGRLGRTVFALSGVLACVIVASVVQAKQLLRDRGERNENSVLRYLGPAISSAGKGARLYYRTECDMRETHWADPVPFPRVDVQPPSKGAKGLTAVREMFRSDKNVTVTEGPSGIIRIRIGAPSTRILGTRIHRLRLGGLARHFPKWTIYTVEKARPVKAAMRRLDAKAAPFSPGLIDLMGVGGPPHLPRVLSNVSVEQVLDLTAKTFGGIVIYGACTQPSGGTLFRLDFIDVSN